MDQYVVKTLLTILFLPLACLGQTMFVQQANVGTLTITNAAGGASWVPTDEASLVGWYKETGHTNTSDALAANGDPLKSVRDNSGHDNHLTNFVAGTTMTTNIDSAQNGLACIRFDGVNDYFRADDIYTSYVSGNDTPMVWGMAYRNNKISTAGIWFQGIKSGGEVTFLRAEIDGSNRYFCTRNDGTNDANVYVDWPVDTNDWHVVVWKFNGSTAEWWHDGVSIAPAQAIDVGPMDTPDSDIFFVGRDQSGVYFGGDMGEICIFNAATVNPTNVWTYLQARWATPIAEPDTCLTTFYTNSAAQNDFSSWGANRYFGIFGWDPGANATICSFMSREKLAAGVQYRASLWTQSGNDLATQQGGGQWSHTITGLGVEADHKWIFPNGMAVANGTSYALVISPLSGTMEAVENTYQGGDTAAYSSGQWNAAGVLQSSTTRDPKFAVFGQ